jgi:hypothetical protein
MVNGVEERVGAAVGTGVEVGSSCAGGAPPGSAQEVSKIKVKRRKTSLRCKVVSPEKGCRYFT